MNKLAVLLLVVAAWFWWSRDPSVTVMSGEVDFGYAVEYSGDAGSGRHLPMLVALHGNGDTAGNFFETALDQLQKPARIVLLKGPLSYSGGGAWPMDAAGLKHYGLAVREAVDAVVAKYPTVGKPLLLGFSGGAVMAYYQAAVYGDSYASVFPISGRLSEGMLGSHSVAPGAEVYAFHGKQDSVVPFGGGRTATALLRAGGVNVAFAEFDGGHLGLFREVKSQISQLVDEKLGTTY